MHLFLLFILFFVIAVNYSSIKPTISTFFTTLNLSNSITFLIICQLIQHLTFTNLFKLMSKWRKQCISFNFTLTIYYWYFLIHIKSDFTLIYTIFITIIFTFIEYFSFVCLNSLSKGS